MKTSISCLILMLTCLTTLSGQKTTYNLSFTGKKQGVHRQLDSIRVTNLTQGGFTVLNWPDTTISVNITTGDILRYIGFSTGFPVVVQEVSREKKQFQVAQNYPNPVNDQSIISIYIPEKGNVGLTLTDPEGRLVSAGTWQLEAGWQSFRFAPGTGSLYFLIASWNGINKSIKILSSGTNTLQTCRLDYQGSGSRENFLCGSTPKNGQVAQESCIIDSPAADTVYTFEFATNIPCPGTPTVTWEGQVYNTIQIMSQCWLKENLNVGTMINGTQNQTNNGILEKYCYDNSTANCTQFGGLYQWSEMMQYTTNQGAQGICPAGWHIPTDEEWKVLEGTVDGQYGIGDPVWDEYNYRGLDAGKNLKTTTGWSNNGNGTDLYGFSVKPAGGRTVYATFDYLYGAGLFWASTEFNVTKKFIRTCHTDYFNIYRTAQSKDIGYSVRCLRDN
jgi:uncharacterized protein (TIGR02145 family)